VLSPHSPPDCTAPGHDDHADDSVYPSTIPFSPGSSGPAWPWMDGLQLDSSPSPPPRPKFRPGQSSRRWRAAGGNPACAAHHVPDGRLGDVAVEGEDLLGDGINVAAHEGSMSTHAGTESRHLRKSQRILQQPVGAANVQVAGSSRLRSAPPAPIAQAVRKGAGSDFLGDRALPITYRRSSPRT
jgi:hypothetical protein